MASTELSTNNLSLLAKLQIPISVYDVLQQLRKNVRRLPRLMRRKKIWLLHRDDGPPPPQNHSALNTQQSFRLKNMAVIPLPFSFVGFGPLRLLFISKIEDEAEIV